MTASDKKSVCVVIPVFEDKTAVKRLLEDIAKIQDYSLRAVVIDDGSIREPLSPSDVKTKSLEIELVSLTRNLGHQRAIAIGLSRARKTGDADAIVVMDGDGEDRPQDIPALIRDVIDGKCDIAVAERGSRHDGPAFKLFHALYRILFWCLTGRQLAFGNFSALSPSVLARLLAMEELWMHVPSTFLVSGATISRHRLDRGARYDGTSKMNLVSLTVHGLRSFAPFSETVLARILWGCGIVAGAGIAVVLIAAAMKLFGQASPGWLTIVAGTMLNIVLQLGVIALITLLIAMTGAHRREYDPMALADRFIAKTAKVPAGK